MSRRFSSMFGRGRSAVLALLVAAALPTLLPASAFADAYVVTLNPGVNGSRHAKSMGVTPSMYFKSAINGYAVNLSAAQKAKLAASGDVAALTLDSDMQAGSTGGTPFDLVTQQVPTGVSRIGGLDSRTADIDGTDDRVDIDVAVIDSGIDSSHPDLNVAGGVNCSSGKGYDDGYGHGTHVAGTIGALDNGYGVVGVAPGARLWAVRVLNKGGRGNTSSFICGVDWVTAHADVIDVANMSLVMAYADDGNCGYTGKDPLHQAVCASVAAGVTYVAAAGNNGEDAASTAPASYDEAITVSAFADFDGLSGGLGAPTCGTEVDDTLAYFSNFGADVDLAAPGVCITSTVPGGQYAVNTGTSMAAPHVAGAAALYLSRHASATPAQVRSALMAAAFNGVLADDPDSSHEELLDASGL